MTARFPRIAMTPSCERIFSHLESFTAESELADAGHLVLALLMEESLGSKCLNDLGVSIGSVAEGCLGEAPARTATMLLETEDIATEVLPFSRPAATDTIASDAPWCQQIVERARHIAKYTGHDSANRELTSEHLLRAMVDASGPIRDLLSHLGVTIESIDAELNIEAAADQTLAVDFELTIEDSEAPLPPSTITANAVRENEAKPLPPDQRIFALIDANLNRAREGLRVLEDYARFVQRDLAPTTALKELRHELVAAELAFRNSCPQAMQRRDVAADVGTQVTTAGEMQRENITDVITANARRVQEALRSLEEFGKTVDGCFAAAVKQLRYRSYGVEQLLTLNFNSSAARENILRQHRIERLAEAQLYVLVTESRCRSSWKDTVQAALVGGADVIQLREKKLEATELIHRGQWLAKACDEAGALFILNDRIDLAVACGAHGVHNGQEDGTVSEARQSLSPSQLLGVSTHDVKQLITACREGADYLGVGPVFESQTKDFSEFPGLDFVAEASEAADRPWFAIGGIGLSNIRQVIEAGATRVAVSSAIIAQKEPAMVAKELSKELRPEFHAALRVKSPR